MKFKNFTIAEYCYLSHLFVKEDKELWQDCQAMVHLGHGMEGECPVELFLKRKSEQNNYGIEYNNG